MERYHYSQITTARLFIPLIGLGVMIGIIVIVSMSEYARVDREVHTLPTASGGIFARTPRWEFTTPADEVIITTPVIYHETVFVRTDRRLYALDAGDGQVRWSIPLVGLARWSRPVFAFDNYLFVSEASAQGMLISAETGEVELDSIFTNWTQDEPSSLVYAQNRLAISASQASEIPVYRIPNGDIVFTVDKDNREVVDLVTDGSHVFVGQDDEIAAYDLEDGDEVWRIQIPEGINRLALYGRIIFAVNNIGQQIRIVAVDTETAERLWTYVYPYYQGFLDVRLTPVPDHLLVVTGSRSEAVIALDTRDGTTRWRFSHPPQTQSVQAVVSGDIIYLRLADRILALDSETGSVAGEIPVFSQLALESFSNEMNPSVEGNLVIVPYSNRQVLCFDLSN